MPAAKKSRGATAIRSEKRLPRKHILAAGGIFACVTFAILLSPSGEDEQHPAPLPTDNDVSLETAIEAPATASVPEIVAIAAPIESPWRDHTVQNGDNLSLIFKRAGYYDRDVYAITNHAPDGKSLTRIYPGQTISFLADEAGELKALRHVTSKLETVIYERGQTGFDSRREVKVPETRQAWASAEITSSLFLAGQEAGLSHNMIMAMANIFGGVIDFVLDPRKGDTIHLLYEELYLDGEKFGDGEVLAASFTNQGKKFNAYRYEDSQGDASYYNEDGVSMRKAFLLAPVDFSRISSNFNLRRLHPIYKTTRPHRGTDYAASTGTPVFAAGDGRVQKAGYSKANGNYVFIQHGEAYVTKYLHLHKRKVKKGQRVSQSQIIGTVGSTGAATGPHLHYEFLVNGVHRNPRTIHKKLPKAKSLASSEMPRFRTAIGEMSTQLAALQADDRLALIDTAGSQ
ncbi:MAG: peptidoglycan DD-metalloendopeptidase family protein [Halioglobus sp.]